MEKKEAKEKIAPAPPWQRPLARIWIVRKSNSKFEVHPSPCVLASGQSFVIKNWTVLTALVSFGRGVPVTPKIARIAPQAGSTFHVSRGRRPRYYEYEIKALHGTLRLEVEGKSKPAIIIDP